MAYTYKIHTYKKEKVRHAFHLTDCSADIAQPYIPYCKWIRFQLIEQLVNYKVNSTILRKVLLSKNCQLPGLHLKLTICHYHCQRCSVMHDGHGISAKSKHHLRPFFWHLLQMARHMPNHCFTTPQCLWPATRNVLLYHSINANIK